MVIDFHTHIFPAVFRQNRQAFFASEPAFKQLYQSPKSRMVGAAELLRSMDANRVDQSVVFGFPWKSSDNTKRHNDYVMETVRKNTGRFIGLGCFDVDDKNAPAEARRCLDGGLQGIGELAFYRGGIDATSLDRLAPVMAVCAGRNVPVLIHTNEPVGHPYPGKTANTLAQIYSLIRRFENNKIILAHWGGGLLFYSLMKKEVKAALKNVYFDTAASPFLYDPEIYPTAVRLVGLDKILFGSDYPLLPPARYFQEMQAAGLSKEQIKTVCGLNAAKLLGSQ